MDDFQAALTRLVKDWLEREETPFAIARQLLLASAALLSIHDKLSDEAQIVDVADRSGFPVVEIKRVFKLPTEEGQS